MGKQFGSFGNNIPNAGYVAGNLNQVGDEDEMEVINDDDETINNEVVAADSEDEYEEYLAEDDPNGEGEIISNEIQPPPPPEPSKQAATTSDTDIINALLNNGYDWRVRPPGTNLSLPVNMLIRSISKIDDVNMEYSIQLTFRESWIDGRLAYGLPRDSKPDFIILAPGQQIWMPDSFFQNEKQAQKHMIDKPNVMIRVHKDGSILYSVRISLVLSCPMHLHMLVIVSWVSFWLDRNAVPARVTLGVTTLLTITTQASGINAKLPPVSYVKAVDLWIGACMTFIFTALLEFAAVTYISSRKFYKQSAPKATLGGSTFMSTHPMTNTPLLLPALPSVPNVNSNEPEVWVKQRPSQQSQVTLLRNSNGGSQQHHHHQHHGSSTIINNNYINDNDIEFQQRRRPRRSRIMACIKSLPIIRYIFKQMGEADNAKRVDYVSRALFPCLFITFNILYWTNYSGKYDEE
uniref:Uncharacterized protein n=1 Tax=Panagrolaimus sp. ES5 TaxID=591445 RepID=A0AC34FU85_9BILA